MKIGVVFYSTWGHIYRMARAAAEGAQEVEGADVRLLRIPETMTEEALMKMGALQAQKSFADVPVAKPQDLADLDGLLFGFSTRYGMMAAQAKAFLDYTGSLWSVQKLAGKPVGLFTSTATQHGGNEVALLSALAATMHHGMIPVGLPYTFQGQMGHEEVMGGTPYGASTISGGDGSRMPSVVELAGAGYLGRRVAEIAGKLRD